jgi:hypothetical protein
MPAILRDAAAPVPAIIGRFVPGLLPRRFRAIQWLDLADQPLNEKGRLTLLAIGPEC